MVPRETLGAHHGHEWLARSGVIAIVGTVLWIGIPWVQTAVLGTRPYVTSVFDVASFVGWLLMLVGLVSASVLFSDQFGRLGRVSIGTTAVGMVLVSGLLFRRVALFVDAGFQAVPATGEDPAGLLLSLLTILGYGLIVVGAGGIGFAFRTVDDRPAATSWLLLLAPTIPLVLVGINLLVNLPLMIGRFLVNTNAVFVPFGLAWIALGRLVWSRARSLQRTGH